MGGLLVKASEWWRGNAILSTDDYLWHRKWAGHVALFLYRIGAMLVVGALVVGVIQWSIVAATIFVSSASITISAGTCFYLASWSMEPGRGRWTPGDKMRRDDAA